MLGSKHHLWHVLCIAVAVSTIACAPNPSSGTAGDVTSPPRPANTTNDGFLGATSAPSTIPVTTTGVAPTTSTQPTTTVKIVATTIATTTTLPTPTLGITRYGIPVRVSEPTEEGWKVFDPCGTSQTISKIFPVREIQVVLDPGHGGKDPGTRGPTGLKESELNLEVAVAVAQLLQEQGFRPLLTRTGDYYIELDERIALSDAANATAMVSIHHNAPTAAKSNKPGTEVFAQTGDTESARLAGLLHQEVFETLDKLDDIQWTSRWDAGALRVVNSDGGDAYSLVRKPETTNALLEVAYLASPSEGAFMAEDGYVQLVARPIAVAIKTFLTTDQSGSPLLERARIHNPSGGRRTCPEVDLE